MHKYKSHTNKPIDLNQKPDGFGLWFYSNNYYNEFPVLFAWRSTIQFMV